MQAIPYTHFKHLYIDGRWEKVADAEPVLNPSTEQEIGFSPVGDVAAARAAIQAARTAFDSGAWPQLAMSERAACSRCKIATHHRRSGLRAGSHPCDAGRRAA